MEITEVRMVLLDEVLKLWEVQVYKCITNTSGYNVMFIGPCIILIVELS